MSYLFIIPGWEGSKETWQNFIKLAQNKFDVHCIDMPCFGEEPCPKEVWGVENYANFVKAKIQIVKANLSNENDIILLGHSFGGAVATYLVANNPSLVDKLILSGAAIYRPKKLAKRIIFGFFAKAGKLFFKLPIFYKLNIVARKILHKIIQSPDYGKTKGIKKEIYKKIIRQDMGHLLSKINIPTLVIWGEKDNYVPIKYGKKIGKNINNSRFEVIRHGTHGSHQNNTDIFLNLIEKFV